MSFLGATLNAGLRLLKAQVFNGKKIGLLREGSIMGWRKGNEIIGGVNALLTWKVQMVDGQTGRVDISDNGAVLSLPRGTVGEGSSVVAKTRFRVKAVFGDYLRCRDLIGAPGEEAEGSVDVWVAKLPDLRHSLASQVIDGVTITYSGWAISGGKCSRSATDGTDTQTELVLPVWQLGTGPDSEIWAFQPAGGTGVVGDGASGGAAVDLPITWLVQDNRAWCQV